ncbi:bifunctional DNA primase/polymerase [Thermogemmatispora sp.]|uniref:bifunctional DNA primase/polymerase n=1 Tax=Thermogemmatispora sp. TaxID=1968838 RepID=UPI0035E434DF
MATSLERHRAIDRRRLLDYALSYARHGWRVVPLYERLPDGRCACERAGCRAEHPRVPDLSCATTDEEQIRRWWRLAPRAGIGVVITGHDGSETLLPIPGTSGP